MYAILGCGLHGSPIFHTRTTAPITGAVYTHPYCLALSRRRLTRLSYINFFDLYNDEALHKTFTNQR